MIVIGLGFIMLVFPLIALGAMGLEQELER